MNLSFHYNPNKFVLEKIIIMFIELKGGKYNEQTK